MADTSTYLLWAGAGVVLAVLTLAAGATFLRSLGLHFHATVLALTAGAYPGVMLGEPRATWSATLLEATVALVFALAGAFGARRAPALLAGAWACHALWDVLVHVGGVGVPVAHWYPTLCAAYDLVLAAALAGMAWRAARVAR